MILVVFKPMKGSPVDTKYRLFTRTNLKGANAYAVKLGMPKWATLASFDKAQYYNFCSAIGQIEYYDLTAEKPKSRKKNGSPA